MAENQDKRTELEKLDEMTEAMQSSLENLSTIINQQTILIDIVEKANNKELEDFVKEVKTQLINLNSQKEGLISKLEAYKDILNITDENAKKAMNQLLKALGVFNNR